MDSIRNYPQLFRFFCRREERLACVRQARDANRSRRAAAQPFHRRFDGAMPADPAQHLSHMREDHC